jgi:hypothetical protein
VVALDPTARTHHQRLRADGNRDGEADTPVPLS